MTLDPAVLMPRRLCTAKPRNSKDPILDVLPLRRFDVLTFSASRRLRRCEADEIAEPQVAARVEFQHQLARVAGADA